MKTMTCFSIQSLRWLELWQTGKRKGGCSRGERTGNWWKENGQFPSLYTHKPKLVLHSVRPRNWKLERIYMEIYLVLFAVLNWTNQHFSQHTRFLDILSLNVSWGHCFHCAGLKGKVDILPSFNYRLPMNLKLWGAGPIRVKILLN